MPEPEVNIPRVHLQNPWKRFNERRFSRFMEATSGFVVQKPEIRDIEHLALIPEGSQAVFATSHLSDVDIPAIVAALSPYRQLDIASNATNQRDFKQRVPMWAAGLGHFHDVENTFSEQTKLPNSSFRAQNFDDMSDAMARGRDMVVAAHRPTRNRELPKHAGIGAVFLAQLTGTPIVPVSFDIKGDIPVGLADDIGGTARRWVTGQRPATTLSIGKPIELEPIGPKQEVKSLLEDAGMILAGKRDALQQDPERYKRALQTAELLYQQAALVMQSIAAMLPEGKRGGWGSVQSA